MAARITLSPLLVTMLVLCVLWSYMESVGIFIKKRASSAKTFARCANWTLTGSNASLTFAIFLLSQTP